MGATNTHHRPLVSGIRIVSAKMLGSTLQSISRGTLTGLATRNSDGKKVLVTNLHVMIGGSGPMRPTGREEMYQESTRSANKKVGSLPAWDPDSPAWVPIVGGQDNIADVAMCELDEGVDAEFTLHDHPNHSSRKIIEGVVEPTKGNYIESYPLVGYPYFRQNVTHKDRELGNGTERTGTGSPQGH